jgi:predicted Zn-dependent peptidase
MIAPTGQSCARLPCSQGPADAARVHRLIILENGMEVLLISDPKTDKASASMDVKVGHLSDPEDLQGLAHFCEHLMFMGTEKVGPCAVQRGAHELTRSGCSIPRRTTTRSS